MKLQILSSALFLFFALLCAMIVKTTSTTISLGDGNTLDIDEPKNFCGIELKIAVRKFCREKVFQLMSNSERTPPNKSTKKCGQTLMHKCCLSKCNFAVFLDLCPYRYVNKR